MIIIRQNTALPVSVLAVCSASDSGYWGKAGQAVQAWAGGCGGAVEVGGLKVRVLTPSAISNCVLFKYVSLYNTTYHPL